MELSGAGNAAESTLGKEEHTIYTAGQGGSHYTHYWTRMKPALGKEEHTIHTGQGSDQHWARKSTLYTLLGKDETSTLGKEEQPSLQSLSTPCPFVSMI